jgi:hypothetical protein
MTEQQTPQPQQPQEQPPQPPQEGQGQPPQEGQQPQPTPTPPPAAHQDMSQLPDWAREAITKANAEAAANRLKVREFEQAQLSESERLQQQVQDAQRQAQESAAEATRYRVAAAHGIGADDFDLLGSGTEDELAARAVRIAAKNAAAAAAAQGTPPPPPPPGTRPVEQLQPGATPSGALSEDEALYQSLFGKEPANG